MKEVPKEADAIQNGDLCSASKFISLSRIVFYRIVNCVGGDDEIVVNARHRCSDLLERMINIVNSNTLHFHFVDGHYLVIVDETDLHITYRASLFVSRIVRL